MHSAVSYMAQPNVPASRQTSLAKRLGRKVLDPMMFKRSPSPALGAAAPTRADVVVSWAAGADVVFGRFGLAALCGCHTLNVCSWAPAASCFLCSSTA